jgi:hypothetical protein
VDFQSALPHAEYQQKIKRGISANISSLIGVANRLFPSIHPNLINQDYNSSHKQTERHWLDFHRLLAFLFPNSLKPNEEALVENDQY